MAEKGNPNSISDVGVGHLATRACIEGAAMNVRINLKGLKNEKVSNSVYKKRSGRRFSNDRKREFKEDPADR